jgi:hypothetical protein
MSKSADEAFDKFEFWCRTGKYVRFTEFLDDDPPTSLTAVVTGVDRGALLVAMTVKSPDRDRYARIDFNGATFVVGKRLIEALRGDAERFVCEEVDLLRDHFEISRGNRRRRRQGRSVRMKELTTSNWTVATSLTTRSCLVTPSLYSKHYL